MERRELLITAVTSAAALLLGIPENAAASESSQIDSLGPKDCFYVADKGHGRVKVGIVVHLPTGFDDDARMRLHKLVRSVVEDFVRDGFVPARHSTVMFWRSSRVKPTMWSTHECIPWLHGPQDHSLAYEHLIFTDDYSVHMIFEMLKGKALLAARMWPNMGKDLESV